MPADAEQPPQQQPPPQPLNVNLNLGELDAPPSVGEDRQSEKERKLFGESRRTEELREALHTALVISLRVAMMFFIAVFSVRVLHFILPENNAANAGKWTPHGWLTEGQVGAIDKFAFGAFGTVAAQFIRNLVSKR
jgi:hypothetical protein